MRAEGNITQKINTSRYWQKRGKMPGYSLRARKKENRVKRLYLTVIISTCAVWINVISFGKGGKLNIS